MNNNALTATAPAPTVSGRYEFVSTQEVITKAEAEGWHLESCQHARPTKRDPLYAKHLLDFRHPDLVPINGAVPRMLFLNSHDGSCSAKIMVGLFRFACANGLVVGTKFADESVRHTGDAAMDVIYKMQQMAKQTTDLCSQIESWAKKQLDKNQRKEFARFAAQLRWGDTHRFEPEKLLALRRGEDDHGDLWTTFNRVQETTVRGGTAGLSRSGRVAISHPISDISRTIEYNKSLWNLAAEVAETW